MNSRRGLRSVSSKLCHNSGDFQQEAGCELGVKGKWTLEMVQHQLADWSGKNAVFLFGRELCQVAKEFRISSWRPCVGAVETSNLLLGFL